ncbi:hypothetical protein EWM64_g4616 [Hericium alpestre]|uniref:Uncharacterized protein n=1 Tax=Hericium alpestre TaxID=135208 RepID=A0A4Y9ZXT5_9AGAM|nr:hypothetical protein EWM64_g4616 [Hericium alpestre]
MLIPSGPSPLPNNIEARSIETIPFPDGSTTLNFKLNYPANSQFVAVISDHQKFGTGGTSLPLSVGSSDDTSCFNSQETVKGPWTFSIDPTGGLTQCSTTRLWWQQPLVNGSVNFVGVIPGGDSFPIPQAPLSKDSQGTGFNWTVNVRGGTNMFIVAGDDRGLGAGGSAPFTIAYASNDDNSCIQNDAPSSTPGAAAGATPTSSTPSDGSSSGSHTGPIVGGVIGGLCFAAVLAVLLFFIIRRKRPSNSTKERPVDLLQDHDDDGPPTQGELPQYYEPEPFLVPDPSIAATSDAGSTHHGDEEIGMPSYARSQTMTSGYPPCLTINSASPPCRVY